MPPRSNRWRPVAGVGGLVVLNVVLIALLVLRPTAPAADDPPARPSLSTPASRPDTAEQEEALDKVPPSDFPSTNDEGDPGTEPAQRLLVNADAATAWRAETGECGDPGMLERSMDGGETWQELSLELAPVRRVRVLNAPTVFAIGGGEDCQPTYVSSSDAGASWLTNDQFLEGSWYLTPADHGTMATPVGEIETPCEAVDLAALNAVDAAVLCTDGSLVLTGDGGAFWEDTVPSLAAAAIGVGEGGYILAGSHEACADDVAVTVTSALGEEDGDVLCTPARDISPDELAVSAASGAVWLWAENETFVSTDGGQSW